jgi:PKD repeat protein
MRKFLLFTILAAVVALTATTVYAAPPDEPPGLKRAIAVQEAHTDSLLTIPGVVGTAVGLQADGAPVVKIYTESANVAGLPKKLDGIPVIVQVTGKIVALGKPPPVASFIIDNCTDYTVYFDASDSSGTRLSYDWDFGDGSPTGSGEFPSHTYLAADTYTVTLTVTDKFGVESEPTSLDITVPCVSVNQLPLADFTYSIEGLTCNFDGSSSYDPDPDGYITAWDWDFGDGNTGSGEFTSNTYAVADTYTVTLTVTDNEGATGIDTQDVVVGSQEGRYHRPAYIGTSSGSERLVYIDPYWYCTVGTLGVRLTDGTNYYALSNNHVYALEGEGVIGDRILQPGRVDMTDQACGSSAEIEDAVIGNLANYVPITFSTSATNRVDAAVASTTAEMVGQSTPPETGYGIPNSVTVPAEMRMRVQKHGRTTGLTEGRITGINATVVVEYDTGPAIFDGQIEVFGRGFSAGGDSGSLIVTTNGLNPVALLFAGSSFYTFGNPIDDVLTQLSAELGITLYIDGS